MTPTRNRSFTMKFRLDAIKLANQLGSNSAAARELGRSEKNILDWRKKEHLYKAAPRGHE